MQFLCFILEFLWRFCFCIKHSSKNEENGIINSKLSVLNFYIRTNYKRCQSLQLITLKFKVFFFSNICTTLVWRYSTFENVTVTKWPNLNNVFVKLPQLKPMIEFLVIKVLSTKHLGANNYKLKVKSVWVTEKKVLLVFIVTQCNSRQNKNHSIWKMKNDVQNIAVCSR